MNKQEFLKKLSERLVSLSKEDIDKSLDYYDEIIDDRIEDGLSEEEAVEALGSLDEIVKQILSDSSLSKSVIPDKIAKHKFKTFEIVLIILGFPLWLPLLATFFVLVLTAYILLWVAVIVLYSVVFAFAATAVGGIAGLIVHIITGGCIPTVIAYSGIFLISAGLAVLSFFGVNFITKQVIRLSKAIFIGIKKLFTSKRGEQNEN